MFDFESTGEAPKIPSYEEWLEETAKGLQTHPVYFAIKSVFKILRYASAREAAFLEMLEARGVWGGEDTERLNEKTKEKSTELNKETVKAVLRGVVSGELKIPGPTGKELVLTPDSVIAVLNEFLLSDKDLTGESVEMLASMFGEGEETLRKAYEGATAHLRSMQSITESLESLLSRTKQSAAERAERARMDRQARQEREQKLENYIAKCRIAGKPAPNPIERLQMMMGFKDIPEDV